MKTKKMISTLFAAMLTIVLCFSTANTAAQTTVKTSKMECCMMKNGKMMKNGCMMKDGKMMCMTDGKAMPLDKSMTMKNGTTCMANGECTMKNGKKMMMKNGDCMDMNGMMCKSKMKKMKTTNTMAAVYTCPMHPEVMSDKPGKCTKCGMDLVLKK